MPKTKISEYSATANSNTDVASINIDEGCAPSGINNAIRAVMGHLKDFQTGASGDPVTVGGVLTVTGGSASAPAITTSGDTNTGITFPAADTVAVATGGTERVRVDSSGNVGFGATPSTARVTIAATNAVTASRGTAYLYTTDSMAANLGGQLSFGGSYTGTSETIFGAVAGRKENGTGADISGYLQLSTTNAGLGLVERARIDSSGNLLVGTTTAAGKVTVTDGLTIYVANSQPYTSANAAATVLKIGSMTTGRSISSAGTNNASGADYAEYMVKCADFTVAKGDIVGINAQGKLTNIYADAVSFAVKSTNPSYVGGDTWGSDLEGDALEEARQTVDRIAFAGQVPVNVTGATAGQYIVPVNDNGAIKGEAVSNPTFEQYQQAVGKVIAIEQDGRARIIVKVA